MNARRDRLAMTDPEALAFLGSHCHVVIGTHGPRGFPHLVTVSYALIDRAVCFWGYRKSQKMQNILRDPRMTCLLEVTGDAYGEVRGVQIAGVAEIIDEPEAVLTVGRAVVENVQRHARALPSLPGEATPEESLSLIGAKRIAIRVPFDRVISWDHRRLQGDY